LLIEGISTPQWREGRQKRKRKEQPEIIQKGMRMRVN